MSFTIAGPAATPTTGLRALSASRSMESLRVQAYVLPLANPGEYRVFVQINDRHDGAATANLPFLVDAVPE